MTRQYVTQVRDQLQAMRTAELSLQKVRKGRAADASMDGTRPLSAVDKVNAQLLLDAQVCFKNGVLQIDGSSYLQSSMCILAHPYVNRIELLTMTPLG